MITKNHVLISLVIVAVIVFAFSATLLLDVTRPDPRTQETAGSGNTGEQVQEIMRFMQTSATDASKRGSDTAKKNATPRVDKDEDKPAYEPAPAVPNAASNPAESGLPNESGNDPAINPPADDPNNPAIDPNGLTNTQDNNPDNPSNANTDSNSSTDSANTDQPENGNNTTPDPLNGQNNSSDQDPVDNSSSSQLPSVDNNSYTPPSADNSQNGTSTAP